MEAGWAEQRWTIACTQPRRIAVQVCIVWSLFMPCQLTSVVFRVVEFLSWNNSSIKRKSLRYWLLGLNHSWLRKAELLSFGSDSNARSWLERTALGLNLVSVWYLGEGMLSSKLGGLVLRQFLFSFNRKPALEVSEDYYFYRCSCWVVDSCSQSGRRKAGRTGCRSWLYNPFWRCDNTCTYICRTMPFSSRHLQILSSQLTGGYFLKWEALTALAVTSTAWRRRAVLLEVYGRACQPVLSWSFLWWSCMSKYYHLELLMLLECGSNIFLLFLGKGVTRIKFLTDGVLIREMMEDPLLAQYRSGILLIEFLLPSFSDFLALALDSMVIYMMKKSYQSNFVVFSSRLTWKKRTKSLLLFL